MFGKRIMLVAGLVFGLGACAVSPRAQAAQAAPAQNTETVGTAPPSAESSALPARLSEVEGPVQIAQLPAAAKASHNGAMPPPPPADELFQQAVVNMPVMAGMEVETGADGRAELQFTDGSVVRIAPNSALSVLSLSDSGEKVSATRGLTYYELPDGSGTGLTAEAGPDAVVPAPNSLVRIDMDQTPYRVAVLRGSARVNDAASDVGFGLTLGQTATLDPAAADAYDVLDEVASNSWDAWNSDRDAELAEMAAGQTNARVANGDQDAEAWNDLDYYGTWYDVPGAGMAWGPDGVDASFDPYGAGAWGYYPSAGYTWISSYPWGWLPYRCGGWNYFDGFGWLWQPGGGCGGVGWYPYTGVHRPPHGYRLPPPPLDPRLRTRLRGAVFPRPEPLQLVSRGPQFQFRQIGGARPDPRSFPLPQDASGDSMATAPVLPLMNRQQYRAGQDGEAASFANGAGGELHAEHVLPGRAIYKPFPRSLPAPANGFEPAPRPLPELHPLPMPAPRPMPPMRPMPMPQAPHFSAPAPRPR